MQATGRNVATGEQILVEAAGGLITHVDPLLDSAAQEGEQIGIQTWLAPGFVDLQVNGFAGVDYNDPQASHEEIDRSLRVIFSTGVTRLLPTVITGSPEDMLGALQNLAQARESLGSIGLAMEGFHVEGPHISPDDGPRGAHPKQWVRKPDPDEFRRWQETTGGLIKLVTLAPEWPGATHYIEQIVREGVVVSIGHTGASPEQIRDAVSSGATLSTHLGNGADKILPRHPNYIWEQLASDRLAASFIVDGLHLPESFLKVAVRAKGVERSVLVTDAVMPAMCQPGDYMLGEVAVELKADQRVVLRGGDRLAGSSLRMDRAIETVRRTCELTLAEAVSMASINPARVGRIGGRQRGLTSGTRADVTKFAWNEESGMMKILETWLAGEKVFAAA